MMLFMAALLLFRLNTVASTVHAITATINIVNTATAIFRIITNASAVTVAYVVRTNTISLFSLLLLLLLYRLRCRFL